jgi:hypothetical protein
MFKAISTSNNTSNKLNSHMESAGLEPVTRTVVKDDALAAYATHATEQMS